MTSGKKITVLIFAVLVLPAIFIFLINSKETNQSTPIVSEVSEVSEEIPRLTIGDTVIDIEIVRTADDRRRGLSGRKQLASQSGMLFIFDNPDFYGIWMKDMNFSLDIIWIDENLYVVDIEKSVEPGTYPQVFKPETSARYVLEVNSGFSELNGVEIGSKVQF